MREDKRGNPPPTNNAFEFIVRGYECGPDEAATLPSVLNYMQEAAGRQALTGGFARQDFEAAELNISWVLTRLYVQMTRYPRWEEHVTVTTWPSGGRKIVVDRDFVLRVGDEIIGRATSEWALINLTTRKIAPIPPSVFDTIDATRPRALPDLSFARLRWDCRAVAPEAVRLLARRGDLDINGHVNNARCIEWLIESLPTGAEKPTVCELAFKAETRAGDEIAAESVEIAPGTRLARIAAPDGTTRVLAKIQSPAANYQMH